MLLNQRTFIGGQSTRLSDQRLRHSKETDIVQEPREGKPFQLFPMISQPHADLRRQDPDIHEIRNQRRACRTTHSLDEQSVASFERRHNFRRQGRQWL